MTISESDLSGQSSNAANSSDKSGAEVEPKTPRWKVLRSILDFARAMRTGPATDPEEAAEWAKIEVEFTNRCDEKAA